MKHLTDNQLEISIERVRARELETLNDMLKHLQEVERRKLYSKRGYTSLYDYAMKKLKYSGDQAHRRISAMRLLSAIPEIEEKIVDGSLKLTHLTDAHTFFRKSEQSNLKHTKEEKLEILTQLENTTKNESMKVLYQQEAEVRYSFAADKSLEDVVERLKGLHPHLSFDELMKKICKLAFEKLDPIAKAKRTISKAPSISRAKKLNEQYVSTGRAENRIRDVDLILRVDRASEKEIDRDYAGQVTRATRVNQGVVAKSKRPTRYIPTHLKREVWVKAEGKCESCSSRFALEYDHIKPFAMGGTNSRENLRLLCRNCNQRKAIEVYGIDKVY